MTALPQWDVRCLSPGGGCDSYIRVRAADVHKAARRAQRKVNARHEDMELFPEDWQVTYVCLCD